MQTIFGRFSEGRRTKGDFGKGAEGRGGWDWHGQGVLERGLDAERIPLGLVGLECQNEHNEHQDVVLLGIYWACGTQTF